MTQQFRDMELLQALMEAGGTVGKLELEYRDKTYTMWYRPLGYMAKSKCVSMATEYVPIFKEGSRTEVVDMYSRFRLDIYRRECLKEMFKDEKLENPVPITDVLLDRLMDDVGEQLSGIIPDPGSSTSRVNALKKEPETSGEEDSSP